MLGTARVKTLAVLAALALLATACPQEEPEDTTQEEDTETETEEEEDDQLDLGYILPETGQLAFLGPPQITAVEMAVDDMNDAGGVLENDVTLEGGDEAGDATQASEEAERLLAEDVNAIIGAAASGMSLAIIDQVTGSGVVQCSGSNTGPEFTDYDDDGYYFRTAPTDTAQGPVLAETIVGDGNEQVAIIARADEYGEGLLDSTAEELEAAGAEVVEEILYDPEQGTYDSEVEQAQAADPDAVALISFDEGAQILQGMIEAELGPDQISVYGADGIRSSELPELVEPGNPEVLDEMKGTAPGAESDFLERLREYDPELEDELFAAQVYDCSVLIGLAAEAADSADSTAIRDEMIDLTRDGEECSTFEECRDLLDEGEDVDYQGGSGPLEFTENGEPEAFTYWIWSFEDGELVNDDIVESTIE